MMKRKSCFLSQVFSCARGGIWREQMSDPFIFCAAHAEKYPACHGDTLGLDPALLKGRQLGGDFSNKDNFSVYFGCQQDPNSKEGLVPGFPRHPHGNLITTLTVCLEGVIDHFDSLGGCGRYSGFDGKSGDMQIMTSGRGIEHGELFPMIHKEKPNPLALFQVWLHSPASYGSKAPSQQMVWREDQPVLKFDVSGEMMKQQDPSSSSSFSTVGGDGGGVSTARLVLGDFGNTKGPKCQTECYAANPESDIAIWLLEIAAGGTVKVPPAARGDATHRSFFFYDSTASTTKLTIASAENQQEDSKMTLNPGFGVRISGGDAINLSVAAGAGNAFIFMLQGVPVVEPYLNEGQFLVHTQKDWDEINERFNREGFGKWQHKQEVFSREHPRMYQRDPESEVKYPPKESTTTTTTSSSSSFSATSATS